MQHNPASPTGDARPVFKVFKCRARLTPASHRRLGEVLRLCCGFYNAALEERIGAWTKARISISCYDQCKSLTAIRNNTQFPEFAALSVQVFRGVLQRLDRSFRDFFRRAEGDGKPGFPRFKAAQRWRTVEIAKVSRGMVRRHGRHWRLHVKGLPPMQLRMSRALPEGAELKTLRVVRKPLRTEVHLGFAFPRVAPVDAVGWRGGRETGGEPGPPASPAAGGGPRGARVRQPAEESGVAGAGVAADLGRQPASPALDGVGAQPGLRFFRDRRLADRQPIALGEGDRGGTRTQCAGQGGAEPGDLRAGMGNVFHALEGQGCERRPSGGGSRAAWNQPGLPGMRRRGAEKSGCSRPRLSGLRAGAGPRCQCGKEYPATGFGPFTGGEWRGDPASRGGGRSGEPIILRSKRGSGAARRRTVSCQVMYIVPVQKGHKSFHINRLWPVLGCEDWSQAYNSSRNWSNGRNLRDGSLVPAEQRRG